jgi:hypothetical protein
MELPGTVWGSVGTVFKTVAPRFSVGFGDMHCPQRSPPPSKAVLWTAHSTVTLTLTGRETRPIPASIVSGFPPGDAQSS